MQVPRFASYCLRSCLLLNALGVESGEELIGLVRDYVTCSKNSPSLFRETFSQTSFCLCCFHLGILFIIAALGICS